MIVADTNLIVALTVETEMSALAERISKRDVEWFAPLLWESEFRNAMLAFIRSGRISPKRAGQAFQDAMEMVESLTVDTGAVLRIAEANGLTAYDAEFASLSEWLDCPLLSFDAGLLQTGLATHPEKF